MSIVLFNYLESAINADCEALMLQPPYYIELSSINLSFQSY